MAWWMSRTFCFGYNYQQPFEKSFSCFLWALASHRTENYISFTVSHQSQHSGERSAQYGGSKKYKVYSAHNLKQLITVDICSFYLNNCAPCRLHFLMKMATYNFLNHIIQMSTTVAAPPSRWGPYPIISLSRIVLLSNRATNFHWTTFGRHKLSVTLPNLSSMLIAHSIIHSVQKEIRAKYHDQIIQLWKGP